jgi:excisionase family DNA binding protein
MTARLHPDDVAALAQAVAALMADHPHAPGDGRQPPVLLDAAQAADLLGVPKSWVLAEARADRIPHVRLGKYVRFEAAGLELWWQARRRGPWRTNGAAAHRAASDMNNRRDPHG